jgi:PAS domain S-box-containing protein
VIILIGAAAFSSVVDVWVWRRGGKGSKAVALLVLAGIIWTLGEALDTASSNVATKFFFEKFKYTGIVAIPVAWAVYALQQTDREKWVTRKSIALLSAVSLVFYGLVLTNEATGLFFSRVTLNSSNPFYPLNETFAPGYILFLGYVYSVLFATSLFSIEMLIRSRRLYNYQAIALLLTAAFPWIIALIFDSTSAKDFPFDPTALATCLATAALAIANPSRLHVKDVISVARRSLMESMVDALIILDGSNHIVDLNPAAQRLINLSRSQIVGCLLSDAFLGFPVHEESHVEATATNREFVLKKGDEIRTFDARTSPIIDWRGHVTCRIVVLHDVTERKKAHEEVRKRIEQQASFMKSAAEMIRSMDLHERLHAIADAINSQGWRRVVISVRDENMEITSPDDLVTVGLTDEERKHLWDKRPPGKVVREQFGSEYERFRIGEFYYLPWSDPWVRERSLDAVVDSHLKPEDMIDWNPNDMLYAPLRLADGRIVGRLSVDDPLDGKRPTKESLAPLELFLHLAAVAIENAQLIHQLHDANVQVQDYANKLELKVADRTRELKEAQGSLLKAERLAAIGELAAMVGHDLRNPLTGIAGASYYLKTKYSQRLDKKAKEMLETVEKAVKHSNKIINDLLEYSREIRLELDLANPKVITEESLAAVEVPKSVRIVDLTETKPELRVDVDKLKRVFVNLIKNAVDAMPQGGTLTIKSRLKGENVEISLSDTGTGMTKDVLNKLWSPLFTTKAKGMGFGLPICKRFIEEGHGGKISVKSTPGRGSEFVVSIPLKRKAKERDDETSVIVTEPFLSVNKELETE